MLHVLKQKCLHYVTTGILSAALFAILPACAFSVYQPQVPEHLLDNE